MKSKKKTFWLYLAGALVIIFAVAFTSLFFIRELNQTKEQEALLEITSATAKFSELKTGTLELKTTSKSDSADDKKTNYNESTLLTFTHSDQGYDYVLEQKNEDDNSSFRMKEIDGECFLDQGSGFAPYPKKETSLPAAIGMMLVNVQQNEVKGIKTTSDSNGKEITVQHKLSGTDSDGIDLQKMVRVYHLSSGGLLCKAEETLEGDIVRDGNRIHIIKTSVATLKKYSQEIVIS